MIGQHLVVGDTLHQGLQLVLSKTIRIGDTKYNIWCTYEYSCPELPGKNSSRGELGTSEPRRKPKPGHDEPANLISEAETRDGRSDGGLRVAAIWRRVAHRRHLVRVRVGVRGHLMAPHLPHGVLQVSALHHRPNEQEAGEYEELNPGIGAGHHQEVQVQEDGSV